MNKYYVFILYMGLFIAEYDYDLSIDEESDARSGGSFKKGDLIF
tara:strand:- start:54 stop:185 length:132 start_codon:yes stop_codon:yes gene_type:complete